jgi:hypothetical protein
LALPAAAASAASCSGSGGMAGILGECVREEEEEEEEGGESLATATATASGVGAGAGLGALARKSGKRVPRALGLAGPALEPRGLVVAAPSCLVSMPRLRGDEAFTPAATEDGEAVGAGSEAGGAGFGLVGRRIHTSASSSPSAA